MTATLSDINPYLALVLVGFLPHEVWRWLGLLFSRGLDEEAEFVVWVKAVATAILAGVVAQLIFTPPGALATVPLAVRLVAIAAGFGAFLVFRRSVFAGVVTGEIALVAGALILQAL